MTTAILSALAEEQQGLIAQLQRPECIRHAGRDFWRGDLQGRPVVLALSRIGKVAAATTATALAERFGVARILFTGVAGGIGPGVQVGDVVVAEHLVQHDMDASPLFPRYEVPLYGRSLFPADAALSALLQHAARAGVAAVAAGWGHHPDLLAGRGACTHGLAVHHGLVASGDRFVATAAESRALQQALPAALAVEMEGAAVAQVCCDYGLPFAVMRTVSDRADDAAHVEFPRFVREVASRYAEAVVLRWLDLLPYR